MTLILNRIARQVVESLRGSDETYVFGKASRMTDNPWHRAWKDAGLPTGKEWCKGVHKLRHTFGKRLRDAGVDSRDVQDLLHHMPRDITRHYSAPEIKKRWSKSCQSHSWLSRPQSAQKSPKNFPRRKTSHRKRSQVARLAKEILVGRGGFEPPTNWLKASCSTD